MYKVLQQTSFLLNNTMFWRFFSQPDVYALKMYKGRQSNSNSSLKCRMYFTVSIIHSLFNQFPYLTLLPDYLID